MLKQHILFCNEVFLLKAFPDSDRHRKTLPRKKTPEVELARQRFLPLCQSVPHALRCSLLHPRFTRPAGPFYLNFSVNNNKQEEKKWDISWSLGQAAASFQILNFTYVPQSIRLSLSCIVLYWSLYKSVEYPAAPNFKSVTVCRDGRKEVRTTNERCCDSRAILLWTEIFLGHQLVVSYVIAKNTIG